MRISLIRTKIRADILTDTGSEVASEEVPLKPEFQSLSAQDKCHNLPSIPCCLPSPGAQPGRNSINIYPAKVEQSGRCTKPNFLVV